MHRCEVFAAQVDLPMSPVRQRDGAVVDVVSPAKSAQKVLECMAEGLVLRSMSERDAVTVSCSSAVVEIVYGFG